MIWQALAWGKMPSWNSDGTLRESYVWTTILAKHSNNKQTSCWWWIRRASRATFEAKQQRECESTLQGAASKAVAQAHKPIAPIFSPKRHSVQPDQEPYWPSPLAFRLLQAHNNRIKLVCCKGLRWRALIHSSSHITEWSARRFSVVPAGRG